MARERDRAEDVFRTANAAVGRMVEVAPALAQPPLNRLSPGAIQVFRPVAGTVLLLDAVGQLQFEVVAHRLEHE